MQINPSIFKSYDIRGIYPTDINEESVRQIVKSIHKFFASKLNKKDFTIVLGYDMRLSSPSLTNVARETLVEMGAKVIDVGLVSTPSFYFSVSHYKYDAGIQITASHNPKDYNGIKIVLNSPTGLIKIGKSTGMEDIKNLSISDTVFETPNNGTIEKKENVLSDDVKNAIELLGNPKINKYKIVADPANAMGAQYIEALFNVIPADLIKMNFDLDGSFPSHQPDPLQAENLVDIQKKVVDEGADFGLAPDGDGDRLFFVDEKGNIVPPTIITALVARELLRENPGEKILFDIRYIITPTEIVKELGGIPIITRVGHAFITEELNKTGGIFAGESSAHYYYRSNGNAESQLATILSVLKVLTEEGKSLSEVTEELRRSFESGEINFEVHNSPEIMEALKEKYKDGQFSDLDGIAITYPNWRFSVRTSNTEPLLRLNVEGKEKETVDENTKNLVDLIKSLSK